uniref:Uncharacterized protein n=1 Tax=viral metagenome TaxID=1070528 RepID=A0A6M3K2U4_9ZZZZ
MVKQIRETIADSAIIKPLLVLFLCGIFTWLVVSVRDIPATYVGKEELKSVRTEIRANREKDITNLEKIMNIGFNNIKINQERQEAKIDRLLSRE